MKKRLFYCCLGVIILGFGSAILRTGQVGNDPCVAMNGGIALFLGSSLGVVLMVFQLILLICVFFLNKSYIGPGTFINGLLLGYVIDGFCFLFQRIFDVPDSVPWSIRIPCTIFGILFFTLGVSLYFTGNLGLSPYDAAGRILNERTSFSYPVCRIFTDVLCAIFAILLHGPIGYGTIIIAFFTGPLIQFWNKNFSEPLFHGKLLSKSDFIS